MLSSGFLAFAGHSGFLQAVEDSGVKVAGVMGTSAGALAGSLYCAGYTPRQVRFPQHTPSHMLSCMHTHTCCCRSRNRCRAYTCKGLARMHRSGAASCLLPPEYHNISSHATLTRRPTVLMTATHVTRGMRASDGLPYQHNQQRRSCLGVGPG